MALSIQNDRNTSRLGQTAAPLVIWQAKVDLTLHFVSNGLASHTSRPMATGRRDAVDCVATLEI